MITSNAIVDYDSICPMQEIDSYKWFFVTRSTQNHPSKNIFLLLSKKL